MTKKRLKIAGILVIGITVASIIATTVPTFKIESDSQSFKEYLKFAKQLVDTPSIDADVQISMDDKGMNVFVSGIEPEGKEAEVHMSNTRLSIPLKNGGCTLQYKENIMRNQMLVYLLIKSQDSKAFGTIKSQRTYNAYYSGEPLNFKKAVIFHDAANNKSRIHIPFKASVTVPIQEEKAD